MFEDTIAAIATPPGPGGIGIVRVSGPLAERILHRLFQAGSPVASYLSHHLYHGSILSPARGVVIDEVLVALMRAPHSFTGEDVLEIHGHGGSFVLQRLLAAVISTGARLAEPGEFSRRAFLNGRMDLAQAESIADIIQARTEKGLEIAVSRLQGDLRRVIERLIDHLTGELVRLEADIDFTEDEGGFPLDEGLPERLRVIVGELEGLAATYEKGRLYREGVGIVIAGRVNVGKSSLLNRLYGGKRAIVTPVPGTTRDFIEEAIDLNGMPARITDTAGIRTTDNLIEQAGIELVWERVEVADAVVVLLDGSEALTDEDRFILERVGKKPVVPVINKSDLPRVLRDDDIMAVTGKAPVWISARNGTGIDALKNAIRDSFLHEKGEGMVSAVVIANERCRSAVQKAVSSLRRAVETASADGAPELVSADIRDALDGLGEIGGRTLNDDVLDRIFASFCIGK